MDRRRLAWIAATVAAIALAGAFDRLVITPSDRHALVVTALTAAAAAITWWITRRPDLAFVAAAVAGTWAIPHHTPRRMLLVAFVPAALMALPPRSFEGVPGWASASLGALAAGTVALSITGSATVTLVAATVAGVGIWIRPETPTEGAIGTLWSAAVLLPGAVLLLLVVVNAATGWFEQVDGEAALWLGLGLAGVLALFSVAALGLSTILESDHPAQRTVWMASLVGVGLVAGAVAARDTAILQVAVSSTVVPVAGLAAILVGRVGGERAMRRHAAAAVSVLLAAIPFGLV